MLSAAIVASSFSSPNRADVGPTRRLRNGALFPMLGLGVGNMQRDDVEKVAAFATDYELRVGLIDTAMASANADVLSRVPRVTNGETWVLTKVWYTHLGYFRTKLAVEEEIFKYGRPSLDAVLLHWPRCDDAIGWMNCEAEENALLPHVKRAGPPPHLHQRRDSNDPEPWVGSWRALEELHAAGRISGAIGISNFDAQTLRRLLALPELTTKPHVLQGNVWSVVFDPELMRLCEEHDILFQAYAVLSSTVGAPPPPRTNTARFERWARASEALKEIGAELSGQSESGAESTAAGNAAVTVAQVIQRWLMQRGVSVVPRATTASHVVENARVRELHALTPAQMRHVQTAVEELLRALNGLPPGAGWRRSANNNVNEL